MIIRCLTIVIIMIMIITIVIIMTKESGLLEQGKGTMLCQNKIQAQCQFQSS